MHDEASDKPVAQYLKVITFLDLIPGYADSPETGEKIIILTVAHAGEIEQPMFISLKDSMRIARHLISALAFHGDQKAKEILPMIGE